jgi:hypothetical protein
MRDKNGEIEQLPVVVLDQNATAHAIIYIYQSPSKKRYVGQTFYTLAQRAGKNGIDYQKCPHFWHAIQKYGWENFTVEIVCSTIGLDNANCMEDYFIALYDTTNPTKGYNLTTGGSNGKHSEETKEKIRAGNLGKIVSEETRAKISAARTGTTMPPKSAEARKKISERRTGQKHSEETKQLISEKKKGTPSHFKGKHHSDESKQNMSLAHKGQPSGMKGKTQSDDAKRKMSDAKKGQPSPHKGKAFSVFLSVEELAEIRKLHDEGHSNTVIGKRYNCSAETIRRVVLRKDRFENT